MRSLGLGVKAEDSRLKRRGFKSRFGDIFSCAVWIKAFGLNLLETQTWLCCICSNPANERVSIEERLAYKPIFMNEMRGCQLTETDVPQ